MTGIAVNEWLEVTHKSLTFKSKVLIMLVGAILCMSSIYFFLVLVVLMKSETILKYIKTFEL